MRWGQQCRWRSDRRPLVAVSHSCDVISAVALGIQLTFACSPTWKVAALHHFLFSATFSPESDDVDLFSLAIGHKHLLPKFPNVAYPSNYRGKRATHTLTFPLNPSSFSTHIDWVASHPFQRSPLPRTFPRGQHHFPLEFCFVQVLHIVSSPLRRLTHEVLSSIFHPQHLLVREQRLFLTVVYNRQKAKSKYINRVRLEIASQKQSSDTHKTPQDLVKRCWERKINTKASDPVNSLASPAGARKGCDASQASCQLLPAVRRRDRERVCLGEGRIESPYLHGTISCSRSRTVGSLFVEVAYVAECVPPVRNVLESSKRPRAQQASLVGFTLSSPFTTRTPRPRRTALVFASALS
ncbi:hypothetical protein PR048_002474 [Dryococelus australis]|uniref:Uncharacterized protein n=1 Tax=Dryococelus australis TaxID=614101 RepID=A0ABQ9IMQ1_9NEOP|nr:hypothetical protein PR048_002474 [Dryococelus australis]